MLKFEKLMKHSDDMELLQIYCLQELKHIRESFFLKGKLYPELTHLINFRFELEQVIGRQKELFDALELNGEAVSLDMAAGEIEHESPLPQLSEISKTLRKLLRWLLPLVRECEQEGRDIFSQINNQLEFTVVGILPCWLSEGFFLLPVALEDTPVLAVYYYRWQAFGPDDLRADSTLYIQCVDTVSQAIPPGSIKLRLLGSDGTGPPLSNPSVFSFSYKKDAVDQLKKYYHKWRWGHHGIFS